MTTTEPGPLRGDEIVSLALIGAATIMMIVIIVLVVAYHLN